MAIVHLEGFELAPYLAPNVLSMIGGASMNTGAGRTAGGSCVYGNSNTWQTYHTIAPASDEIFFHTGARTQSSGVFGASTAEGACIFGIWADTNATAHLTAGFDATGHILLKRGSHTGTIIATSTLALTTAQQWRSYEVNALIHDTLGKCIIKVDGVEWINFSGDTKNAGTSTRPDTLHFGAGDSGLWSDDILVLDTTGPVNNTWPGEVVIVGLRPAGNGANSGLVGSDGNSVDNYLLVDDPTLNTTDYVGSMTVGALDTYDMTTITRGGNVLAVQPYAYAAKTDAAPKSFKHVMRSASPNLVKTGAVSLSTSYVLYAGPIHITDGDGTGWTVAKVNAHEFGFEVA